MKTPRSITHFGRIDEIATLCERLRALGDRLGPVLVRLDDKRPRDDGYLRLLLDSFDPALAVALDLRDPSWDGVEPLLAEWGAVRVGAVAADAPFRYLRLREPPYDDAALAAWAERVRRLVAAGVTVYCYFRHEDEPTGPVYAEKLIALVRESG